MKVIGIDLSGPSNIADTYLVVLEEQGTELQFIAEVEGADDQRIFRTISDRGKNDRIVIGMDASSPIIPVEGTALPTGNCASWF